MSIFPDELQQFLTTDEARFAAFFVAARRRRLEPWFAQRLHEAIDAMQPAPPAWLATKWHADVRAATINTGGRKTMSDEMYNFRVVEFINKNAKRPKVTHAVWAALRLAVRDTTGELHIGRRDLERLTGMAGPEVSNAITELVKGGFVLRIDGHRGPAVRYGLRPEAVAVGTVDSVDQAEFDWMMEPDPGSPMPRRRSH